MKIEASRRNFLRGMAGLGAFGIAGCKCPFGCQKVKLAAVGVMGKGYSDWSPMLRGGFVEIVAFCDADYTAREQAARKLAQDGINFDVYSVPFYTDYRKLLDDAGILGIDAMTISTPDHVHAPVAIQAMKQGIHVYVQKPLVRTLWELDYFNRTARENGVIVQMGNQGSSRNSMRRCTEVIQSGILGEVRNVHVWTNRPVWPQGNAVAKWVKDHPKGDNVREGLNWDAWLATARKRPFLDKYPSNLPGIYDPWKLGANVYHRFTWRGFYDFGCGAFGDMACHTMNLAFRGLELGGVSDAELTMIDQKNDIAFPMKSIVKLTYKERKSRVQKNADGTPKTLPPVTLCWYDGYLEGAVAKSGNKPSNDIMADVISSFGEIPNTGCYIVGTKGSVLMQDDYGAKCAIKLNGEKKFVDVFEHEGAKKVARTIPFLDEHEGALGKSTVEMKGFGLGHYAEFVNAIRGIGPKYEQVGGSRCFSDVEYCIPQMEGILVGCVAQNLDPNQKLVWCSKSQQFKNNAAANALIKPYIRKGWEF